MKKDKTDLDHQETSCEEPEVVVGLGVEQVSDVLAFLLNAHA
jgi:hypothetical protein